MTASDHRIDIRDWSLLALLSVLWGGSFFFNGVALRELPPLTLVFLRVALAANPPAAAAIGPTGSVSPAGLSGWRPFFRPRVSQQRAAILADRHRTDLYPKRAGLDRERDHSVVHRPRDGGCRRRKTDRTSCRGRRDRAGWRGASFAERGWALGPARGLESCSALPRLSAMDYRRSTRGESCRSRRRLRPRRFRCWRPA